MRIPESEWVWGGYPGHFIGADRCKFRMRTEVGDHVISTVGDFRTELSKEAEEIGVGRTFETMVFKLQDEVCHCGCGMRLPKSWIEMDSKGYNDPESARKGHMKLCYKWAEIETYEED